MSVGIFDIETDGLDSTVIHCGVIIEPKKDEDKVYRYGPSEIDAFVSHLERLPLIMGHNVDAFDIPQIQKHYPNFKPQKVRDTLILTRLAYPNLMEIDSIRRKVPKHMFGSHSLEAWGIRIGQHKQTEFSKNTDWSEFTPEMLEYCVQDTRVNLELVRFLKKRNLNPDAVDLEHEIHRICLEQQWMGFPFDEQGAQKLYAELNNRRSEIKEQLENTFEPTIIELKTKTKVIPFNPSSRQQIADRLMRRGWVPSEVTETGQPKVDEKVLSEITDIPEATLLLEYLSLNKVIGQLAEGDNAWLKLSQSGRIHGRVNCQGTVTFRATHSKPNLGQVPSTRAFFGKECRSLFSAPSGWEMMGSDMSGIELRCLAHEMWTFDDGDYANEILQGDIHTKNQEAAGLPTRDNAKTFIYALCYGSGSEKLGTIVGGGRKEGERLKKNFFAKIPALKRVTDTVKAEAEQGFIIGLDGRQVPVRKAFSALNTKLQSHGAILAKRWVCEFHNICKERGYVHGVDYQQCAWVHDEIQVIVPEGSGHEFGAISQTAIERTREYYGFRVRLDTEYSVGKTWADTH